MLKQVIVMRTDLNMSRGKMVAQGAHACSGTTIHCTRVCVGVHSEEELQNVINNAVRSRIRVNPVRDAGRTQVDPGTLTCAALGPVEEEIIDKVTGELKLL